MQSSLINYKKMHLKKENSIVMGNHQKSFQTCILPFKPHEDANYIHNSSMSQ